MSRAARLLFLESDVCPIRGQAVILPANGRRPFFPSRPRESPAYFGLPHIPSSPPAYSSLFFPFLSVSLCALRQAASSRKRRASEKAACAARSRLTFISHHHRICPSPFRNPSPPWRVIIPPPSNHLIPSSIHPPSPASQAEYHSSLTCFII